MTELITVEEVASYLRVTKKTIYRLLRQGGIPATKIGRQWRFDKASIDKWLRQKSVGCKESILVIDDEAVIQELLRMLSPVAATVGYVQIPLNEVRSSVYEASIADYLTGPSYRFFLVIRGEGQGELLFLTVVHPF